MNPYSLNKLGKIQILIPKLENNKNIANLSRIKPTRNINKYKLMSHTAYFTAKGQTGNKTIHKIANISSTNFQLVLSVVSKRKDTNLLVVFVGYNTVGYFKFFVFYGRLKKKKSLG